jgi:aspartokinase-like uncharacterized kinase
LAQRPIGKPVRPDAVLKVGGSLCVESDRLGRLLTVLRRLASSHTLVLVPGGGRFADEVRRADRRFRLDDSSAHWMAILAMDQTAHLLAAVAGDARLVDDPAAIHPRRLNVLAPSSWLRATDPLPHSWSVTSDSIAAWVARRLGARRLVLLKDVDGLFAGPPGAGRRSGVRRRVAGARVRGVVDPYFRRALGRGQICWIVNGRRPERVATLLETGSTYGTEVTPGPRPVRRCPPGGAARPAPRPASR